MGAADNDPGPGGGQPEGIQDFLRYGSAGGVAFWVGDVGTEPPHGMGSGKFPSNGRSADHREAAEEAG